MKIRINNKKILILMLILLLLILAVGYAVFSETLTISGTANAKGTFDLEFQNAEIVKNIGADREKTTAEISSDKNTLIVNVVDLAYPGAGVEFSVDIVNVGSIPAEVQAVTPTNVTGNDKIKVTGLDVIKADHPKIEAGDKCNIHFTIEWPLETEEILENENSINIGLQIEYTQSTGELFDGKVSHIDTDKEGNTVPEEPTYETLVSQIIAEDYGKSINYEATVKGQKVNNWKVLYNDKSNVYLILDNYLPVSLLPSTTGLLTEGTHIVYSNASRDVLLRGLRTESYWSEFANGYEGAIATGAAKYDMFVKSYNEKYNTELNEDPNVDKQEKLNNDTLYLGESNNDTIVGFWLSTEYPGRPTSLWVFNVKQKCFNGWVYNSVKADSYATSAIRPIVKLPTTTLGTVGETVEIK